MALPPIAHIEMVRGDTFVERIENIVWPNGDTIDWTNAKVWFTAKSSVADLDGGAAFQVTSDGAELLIDDANSAVDVSIPASTTKALDPGVLVYDMQVKDQNGRVGTVLRGNLRVQADTTITDT